MANELFEVFAAELPQTQCGKCGFDGCDPYAHALAEDRAACNLCPPGGNAVWNTLQRIAGKNETIPPAVVDNPHRVQIDHEACIGCYKCVRVCPVDAIVGAPKRLHQVNLGGCTGCDLCIPVCPVDCIHPLPMEDAERHYHQAQMLYTDRRDAWHKHQQRDVLKASRGVTKPLSMTTGVASSQNTTNLAIRARLVRAIAKAKNSGDISALERLETQLSGLDKRSGESLQIADGSANG